MYKILFFCSSDSPTVLDIHKISPVSSHATSFRRFGSHNYIPRLQRCIVSKNLGKRGRWNLMGEFDIIYFVCYACVIHLYINMYIYIYI